ncbi:MAG: 30S ribosomal protein S11, partial [Mariprofundaceae bacterium]
MAAPKASGKKRTRKNIANAVAHIKATFNNTIITFTD